MLGFGDTLFYFVASPFPVSSGGFYSGCAFLLSLLCCLILGTPVPRLPPAGFPQIVSTK